MEAPKDSYKKNAGNATMRKDAYSQFYNKYIKNDANEFFLNLHEGEQISSNSKPFWIPGRLYTFGYDPLYKDVLSYYDKRPIIMVHDLYVHPNTKNELIVGINLNFLPETVKVAVLQFYYEKFKTEIDNAINSYWEGKIITITQKIVSFLKDWLLQLKIFSTKNINFGFAYRQYIQNRVLNPVLVEYDDWSLIPFIQSKDIVGKNLKEIYGDYDKFLTKNKQKVEKRISQKK